MITSKKSAEGNKMAVDFKKIETLCKNFSPELEFSTGKKSIYFLGQTGSGKSTAVNYLLGHEFANKSALVEKEIKGMKKKVFEKQMQIVSENPGHKTAPIGGELESVTPFPRVYDSKELPIAFVDCPGFSGVRIIPEERIFESLSLQMTFKRAQAAAIAVVIDYRSVTTERGALLKESCKILSRFVNNPTAIGQSMLFIFTHVENEGFMQLEDSDALAIQRDTLIEKLEELKKHFEKMRDEIKHKMQVIVEQMCADEQKNPYKVLAISIRRLDEYKDNPPTRTIGVINVTEGEKGIYLHLSGFKPKLLTKQSYKSIKFPNVGEQAGQIANEEMGEDFRNDVLECVQFINESPSESPSPQETEILLLKTDLESYVSQISILDIMISHPDNIFFSNPADNGHSKRLMIGRMVEICQSFNAIDKSTFNFNTYDSKRAEFDEAMNNEMQSGKQLLKRIIEREEKDVSCREKIASLKQGKINEEKRKESINLQKRRLETKENNNRALANDNTPMFLYEDDFSEDIKGKADSLKKSVGVQAGTVAATAVAGAAVFGVGAAISAIPVIGVGGILIAILGPAAVGFLGAGVGGGITSAIAVKNLLSLYAEHKFEYTRGIALAKVDHSNFTEKEKWIEAKDNDLSQGKYSIVYQSGHGYNGSAKIKYFVPANRHPDNVERMKNNNDDIERMKRDIAQEEKELAELKCKEKSGDYAEEIKAQETLLQDNGKELEVAKQQLEKRQQTFSTILFLFDSLDYSCKGKNYLEDFDEFRQLFSLRQGNSKQSSLLSSPGIGMFDCSKNSSEKTPLQTGEMRNSGIRK